PTLLHPPYSEDYALPASGRPYLYRCSLLPWDWSSARLSPPPLRACAAISGSLHARGAKPVRIVAPTPKRRVPYACQPAFAAGPAYRLRGHCPLPRRSPWVRLHAENGPALRRPVRFHGRHTRVPPDCRRCERVRSHHRPGRMTAVPPDPI